MGIGTGGGGAGAIKEARKRLDELLGKDRNKQMSERRRKKAHFSDDEYCKYYLCGFCPYMLFTNTKSDMGSCNHNHSDVMREAWEQTSAEERATYRYEDDMQAFLEDCVRGVDKKIQIRREKSDETYDSVPPDPELVAQMEAIERDIESATSEMDSLNEECRFDDAKIMMMKIEQLQREVKLKAREIENKRTIETGKKLGVCEVCGVLIGLNDDSADSRHLVGKQHLGFEQIRKRLRELKETQEARREHRRAFREKQAERERRETRDRPERDGRDTRDRNRDREPHDKDRRGEVKTEVRERDDYKKYRN
eukprot:TRINITY_DN739_c0_g4_i1.p1 TRINITY_DN739_c0_g4~~TRINITY_DN739_c0_g4_i1.p1  ORF type:complete len:309 (+),score=114.61 TRINITY_DN739_c0_g4_i1:52-978(+)